MIASTIWSQLLFTLQQAPSLSYFKIVYEGRRYNIEPDSLPCIMIDPVKNNELEKDMNQIKDKWFYVNIYAFSSANYNELNKTIVGDQMYKGTLDIENDIIACLQSSYTLGDMVIDTQFDPTIFDEVSMEKYPARGLVIPVKIMYRQINGV